MLGVYKRRAELSFKEGYYKLLAKKDPKQEVNIVKIQLRIKEIDELIYKRLSGNVLKNEDLVVERAYIIFNDIKSRKSVLKAYLSSKIFRRKQATKLKFRGIHPLIVKATVEPSNIKWENLEVSHWNRQFRRSLVIALAIIIMIASIVFIYIIRVEENILPSDNECSSIDSERDLEYAIDNYKSQNKNYCWCKGQQLSTIIDKKAENEYCSDYIEQLKIATTVRVFGSLGVIVINVVLKYALRWLTQFERVTTRTKEQLSVMTKVFFSMFINTTMITLFVNADLKGLQAVFNSDYEDFTREWYTKVGSIISITMFIGMASPHFVNLLIFYPINIIKRKFFTNRYKTQHELNSIMGGPEFDMSTRVSQVLCTIFSCYIYSGGMPLLNVVCFITLFCVYWVDKYLILRYYRTPPLYSNEINDKVISIFPYAILIHCGVSLWMYGSESIFPQDLYASDSGDVLPEEESTVDRLSRVSGILNLTLIALTVIAITSGFFYKRLIRRFLKPNKIVDDQARDDQGSYKDNFMEIKEHGVPSYDMKANPAYKPLIISLNDAANDLKKRSDQVVNLSNQTNGWVENID